MSTLRKLSVVKNDRVTKSWEPGGGPCDTASTMAVEDTTDAGGHFDGVITRIVGIPSGMEFRAPSTGDEGVDR